MNQNWVLVGCYTAPLKGEGIRSCLQDSASGRLEPKDLLRNVPNPSFLCMSPDRQTLFCVNESGRPGSVSSIRFDRKDGRMELLSRQSSQGNSPCHLCTDPFGRWLFVANHDDGSVASLPIDKEGKLEPAVDVFRVPNGHAHWVGFDPTGKLLLAVDKGTDRIHLLRPNAGKLRPHDPGFAAGEPGSGPRHLAFHPNGHFAYVNGEKDLSVTVYAFDGERGNMMPLQRISTLVGETKAESDTTAEISVDLQGRFLYVTNRGKNTVAHFKIGADGRLQSCGSTPVPRNPRHFTLDPSGSFLYAAGQDEHTIECFRVDAGSGRLAPTGLRFETGSPACILFA